MGSTDDNKKLVQAFYDTVMSSGPDIAFDEYCDA